jgi:hypothetical protein
MSEPPSSVGPTEGKEPTMYGGLSYIRFALQDQEHEPSVESEAWWRQRAARRAERRRAPRPVPEPEPIPVEELRDRLRIIGWG